MLLTDPDAGAGLRRRHPGRCAGDRDRHLATAPTSSSRQPTGDILAIDRIQADPRARCPNTHLVMHGSSSVPQEWLEIIREYGGEIKETYGVPVEEIRSGIRQRRAQGQHRHRHPARDDRRDAPAASPNSRTSSTRARRCSRRSRPRATCAGALRGLRLRRPGGAHQARPAGGDGKALPVTRDRGRPPTAGHELVRHSRFTAPRGGRCRAACTRAAVVLSRKQETFRS